MLQALEEYERGNYTSALDSFTVLAKEGNPKAKCYLAALYQFGLGTKTYLNKAIELYLEVAESCIHEGKLSGVAYNNLATIYRVGGPDVDQDNEKANKYAELAKSLGFEM